ncbi:hypothetical protein ACFE04_006939 [Oxalis oulophora]
MSDSTFYINSSPITTPIYSPNQQSLSVSRLYSYSTCLSRYRTCGSITATRSSSRLFFKEGRSASAAWFCANAEEGSLPSVAAAAATANNDGDAAAEGECEEKGVENDKKSFRFNRRQQHDSSLALVGTNPDLLIIPGVGPRNLRKLVDKGIAGVADLKQIYRDKFFWKSSEKMVEYLQTSVGIIHKNHAESITTYIKTSVDEELKDTNSDENPGPKKRLTFCVEGNISVGKTTFLQRIANETLELRDLVEVVPEPIAKWQDIGADHSNILDAFYAEPKRYAYTFQNYVFVTRVMQERESSGGIRPLRLMERSVFSDRMVFVRAVHEAKWMDEMEISIYDSWFDPVVSCLPGLVPDGFIYLRASPDTCHKRMLLRKREEEEGGVSIDYLRGLHEKHESWLLPSQSSNHGVLSVSKLPLTMDSSLSPDLRDRVFYLEGSHMHSSIQKVPALILDCEPNIDFSKDIEAKRQYARQVAEFFEFVKKKQEVQPTINGKEAIKTPQPQMLPGRGLWVPDSKHFPESALKSLDFRRAMSYMSGSGKLETRGSRVAILITEDLHWLHYMQMQHKGLVLTVDFKRPVYLWNLMIRNSANNDNFNDTLNTYSCMLRSGVHGNSFTLPLVLKSCGLLNSLTDGKIVHSHALQTGFQADVFVQTSLIHMYSSCSDFVSSRQVFDEMPLANVVSWNSIISAYCRDHLLVKEAFSLLKRMLHLGFEPNSTTFTGIFGNCTLRQGMSVHCCVFKLGLLNSDVPLANSIINMYGKFEFIDEARLIFDSMNQKSIISWTTIIRGYVNVGNVVEALSVFSRMRQTSVQLDSVIFVDLISGCAQVGNLLLGSSVHCLVLKIGFDFVNPIDNLLVSMYAKCGDLMSARKVFDFVHHKDVFLWTSIIAGYTRSGHSSEALDLFRMLQKTNLIPNEQTLATVLSACADLGSLTAGKEIVEYIVLNGLESHHQIQTSTVHMFCKCGNINEARTLFDKIQNKDLIVWSCMINGYAIHGMGEEALCLFREMQSLGLQADASVLTSILLAASHSGLVEDGFKYFHMMQEEFGIEPTMEHYTCLVDLLSRAGCFELALKTIQELPTEIQASIYAPLLSACNKHGNIKLGEYAYKKLLDLNPGNTGNYVLMANLYASVGKWDEAAQMRSLVNQKRLNKEPGSSQVETGTSFHCWR